MKAGSSGCVGLDDCARALIGFRLSRGLSIPHLHTPLQPFFDLLVLFYACRVIARRV